MQNINKRQLGFTLIEILIVISIIAFIASVIFASLKTARAKARDSTRIQDFKNVSLAMQMYYDKFNAYPPSPNFCCSTGDGGSHNLNFESMAGVLVSEGFLRTVPKAPLAGNPYMHYKYGANSLPGAILVTRLETVSNTTIGPYGSCRPFTNNWCSKTSASSQYCLCHPY